MTQDSLLDFADHQLISRLKADYFFAIDTKDWNRLRGLFADGARFEGFPFASGGPEAFVAGVSTWLARMRSVHHGMMPDLRAVGPDLVRGRWTMTDYLTWTDRDFDYKGFAVPGMYGIRGYGYYDEEYVRCQDARWRISFMRLTRLWIDPLRGDYLQPPAYDVPSVETRWLDPVGERTLGS
ncbi:nuclear transport factor 2 family protein [Sinomonas sp. ASV486]|uniref:nuclear transport factor 2 family protein n=1 Tax=Sinomonas sp. ASV486 TaxID=3051170 RepID=UPI0027DE44CA|nr:nuclear transport factor 2 family protein [Sinomonas sp. ASV486]MDQ4490099.1 nuclear transport factor 2 family protein [Sinomonas sp. ASV486]